MNIRTGPKGFYYKDLAYWLLLGVVGVGMFSVPTKTDRVLVKNVGRVMTIQAPPSDPPRIAFNETLKRESSENQIEQVIVRRVNLNEKLGRASKIPTEKIIKSRQTTLPTMVIAARDLITQNEDNSVSSEEDHAPSQIREASQLEMISHITNRTTTNGRISGKLSLQEGLYLGEGYLDLQLLRHGVAESSGRVDAKNGTFQIDVPDKIGTLLATLYSHSGEKLGEGSLRISEAERSSHIVVGPVQNKTAVHFRSFDSLLAQTGGKKHYGDKGLPAKGFLDNMGAEISADSSGLAEIKSIEKGSWGLARGILGEYKQSIVLSRAGSQSEVTLFRESFVNALLNIAADMRKKSDLPETNSIVWGQAVFDKKPTAGVRVEVEFEPHLQVIYFNAMLLPDASLTATSENGYFAIINLSEGWHSVVGIRGNQYFSHGNVVTEADSVSPLELAATGRIEQVEIRSFDAFTGEPQSTILELQSLSEPLAVDGFSQISLPQIERFSLLHSQPRDQTYVHTQGIYEDRQDSIYVPLIKQSWINQILTLKKIILEQESGVVIGFVQGEAFDVYLPKVENYKPENLVYFNSQGEMVEKGEAGGGFVLFNVPRSIQNVVVVSKISSLASSQVIPVDASAISILSYQF